MRKQNKLFNFLKEPAVIIGVFFIFLIISMGGVSAISSYKQGDTIQLTAVCNNCSFVNLTKITFPNGSLALLGQYPMTKNGTNYNYSFSNTNTFGFHNYVTCGDLDGVLTCEDTEDRSFEITPSGTIFTSAMSIPLFLPMVLMLLITIFWIFLAGRVNSEPVKFAFIIFAGLFLIFAIAFGIVASREVLFGFPLLYGFINSFYRIFIVFTSWGSIVAVIVIMFFVIKKTFSTRGYTFTK